MIPRRFSMLAEITGGCLVGDDARFGAVLSDSRAMEPDALFVCLKGPHHDGHEHAAAAAAAGAAGFLSERALAPARPRVEVGDTVLALGQFARAWRSSAAAQVIAVTGSNGKTTTKNLLAAVLAQVRPTLATRGNLNNQIGLPLTLNRLEDRHGYAVVEMGTNAPGEIATLASIARPDACIVTRVSPAHLAGLGSIEGIAAEKGSLPAALSREGIAVVARDNPWLAAWRRSSPVRRWILFGFDERADVFAEKIVAHAAGCRFRLLTPLGEAAVELQLLGRHNVANALAAAALATGFGIDPGVIARGLATVAPEPGRLQPRRLASGALLLDDSYNANPASVMAAVAAAAELGAPVWLVLGDLAELGRESAVWHRRIGKETRELGGVRLLALGEMAAEAAAEFGPGGMAFDSVVALLRELESGMEQAATIVVKGSRAARMDRVVTALGGRGD